MKNDALKIGSGFIIQARKELERRGEYKKRFFESIGYDSATISHLANPRYAMTLKTAAKIADGLGMKLTLKLEKAK